MKNLDWLKESYSNYLGQKIKELENLIKKLQKDELTDEADLNKIRLNVVDIFSKMFNLSNSNDSEKLKEKYLGHHRKISTPWYVNKEKALSFGKEKEAIIEEIKIKEAEELKNKFNFYYENIDKK